ncbi:MAG: hypothetical protein CXT75_00805 [Methanobacteriota archaeon]|nr:MAG: hypothetical protein CXT75_00805 [Euryarchaeota archaeon]
MVLAHLRKIGIGPLVFGIALLLGGDCQSLDDIENRSDCSDELSDGFFSGIKIVIIDFLEIPESAVVPIGIILVLFGLFLIFLKRIKEKLSPEKEKWDKPDEEA